MNPAVTRLPGAGMVKLPRQPVANGGLTTRMHPVSRNPTNNRWETSNATLSGAQPQQPHTWMHASALGGVIGPPPAPMLCLPVRHTEIPPKFSCATYIAPARSNAMPAGLQAAQPLCQVRFGVEQALNGGVNLYTVPWLLLTVPPHVSDAQRSPCGSNAIENPLTEAGSLNENAAWLDAAMAGGKTKIVPCTPPLLAKSATYRLPAESKATPPGCPSNLLGTPSEKVGAPLGWSGVL